MNGLISRSKWSRNKWLEEKAEEITRNAGKRERGKIFRDKGVGMRWSNIMSSSEVPIGKKII